VRCFRCRYDVVCACGACQEECCTCDIGPAPRELELGELPEGTKLGPLFDLSDMEDQSYFWERY
jgi:hypothetical protein